MPLNKVTSKSNMYEFITYTWNTCKGVCPHFCEYCYCRKWYDESHPQPKLHFDHGELQRDLGEYHFIFVGSSCDMWAKDIPTAWIEKTLSHCNQYTNEYLFQSKNPGRFYLHVKDFPPHTTLGTTIETNRIYPQMGNTPSPQKRAIDMALLKQEGFKTMITLEPIMDFDVKPLVELIRLANPDWVNIGADSKGHHLPEPSKEKILDLVSELSTFTEIKQKNNLKRLMR